MTEKPRQSRRRETDTLAMKKRDLSVEGDSHVYSLTNRSDQSCVQGFVGTVKLNFGNKKPCMMLIV